ncbi:MAG: hypothetical protein AAGA11_08605 [Pseudomonadota bacterium]
MTDSVESRGRYALLVLLAPLLSVSGGAVAETVFSQSSDGVVSIEAESGERTGDLWQQMAREDASGGMVMQVSETQWDPELGSVLSFRFQITQPGRYHVNLRGRSDVTGEVSAWLNLGDRPLPSAGGGRYFFRENWEWDHGNLTNGMRVFLAAGVHTLRVVSRNAQFVFDKVVVAPERDVYAASTFGPAESSSTGLVTVEPPSVDPPAVDPPSDEPPVVDVPVPELPLADPVDGDALLVVEAEHATVTGAVWRQASSATASGGIVMVPSETYWGGASGSSLSFQFNVTTPGRYSVLLRGRTGNGGEKSVWVYVNGRPMPSAGGGRYFYNGDWEWDHGNLPDALRAFLESGENTITLVSRESGLELDKLVVMSSTTRLAGSSLGPGESDPGDPPPPVLTPVPTASTVPVEPPSNDAPSDPNEADSGQSGTRLGFVDHTTTVVVPSCNSAGAVRISPALGNIHLLGNPNYRVFCLASGDYRSAGTINLRGVSGTASEPRVIRLDSDAFGEHGDIYREWPARNQALLPSLVFTDANHWLVDRMTFTGLQTHAIRLWNSDGVVVNRSVVRETDKGIEFKHGSDNNTVQNSFFADLQVDDSAVCVGLHSADTPNGVRAKAVNNRIVNNEIRNCVDGIQLVAPMSNAQGQPIRTDGSRDSAAPLPGDFSGTLIAGNDIYTTPDFYTNCSGRLTQSGPCGMTENAIDIKTASTSATNPVRVVDNRFWGFRTNSGRDALTTGSNDPGSAIVVHFGAVKHVEIARNMIWDSTQGISVARGVSNIDIRDNIISDMAQQHGYGVSHSGIGIVLYVGDGELSRFGAIRGVNMIRNHIVDVPTSLAGHAGRWGSFRNVQASTAFYNVSVEAPAASGAAWVGSGNAMGLSRSAARFAELCTTVRTASIDGGQRVCLNDVLRTGASPLPSNGGADYYWHSDRW